MLSRPIPKCVTECQGHKKSINSRESRRCAEEVRREGTEVDRASGQRAF